MTVRPFVLAALAAVALPVAAQPGALDPTFGDGGVVAVNAGFSRDHEAAAVAIDAQGRIVMAGLGGDRYGGPRTVGAARFLPDGAPDPAFGTDGFATVPLPASPGRGEAPLPAVAVTDGGLVVATTALVDGERHRMAIARLRDDGTLDASFGDGGVVLLAFGEDDVTVAGVVVLADGRVVVAGTAGESPNRTAVLARVLRDGQLDPAFGDGGRTTLDLGGWDGSSVDLAAGPSGTLLVAASAGRAEGGGYESAFVVARLAADGAPDPTFGEGGVRMVGELGGASPGLATRLAVRPDGRPVVTGYSHPGGGEYRLSLLGLTAGGAPDPAFGDDGVVLTQLRGSSFGHDIAVDAAGRLVVGARDGWNADGLALRYLADGTLDPAFGDGGIVRAFSSRAAAAVAVSPQGVVVAGQSEVGSGVGFAVSRLTEAGAFDPAFGGGATVVRRGLGSAFVSLTGVEVDGEGRAVAVVCAHVAAGEAILAVRFLPSGAPDPAFGDGGRVLVPVPDGPCARASLALRPDGTLIVGAGGWPGGPFWPPIVVFGPDGTVDPQPTAAVTALAPRLAVTDVAVDAQGRVVLAGCGQFGGLRSAAVRLRADGTADASFGDGGLAVLTGPCPRAVTVASDGSLFVASEPTDHREGWSDILLVRVLPGGALDPAFGTDGRVWFDHGGVDAVRDLALLADGTLAMAGAIVPGVPTAQPRLALLGVRPDGALDVAFGDAGVVAPFPASSSASALVALPHGGALVAGRTCTDTCDALVLQIRADGSLDPGFGVDGVARVEAGGFATALAVDGEGRAVVAVTTPTGPALARLGAHVGVAAGPEPTAGALAAVAFPNPARGAATVEVAVPTAGRVMVEAFDVVGRRVAVLHEGAAAGPLRLAADVSAWPPGVYVVRATAGEKSAYTRLTVVR